MANVQFSQTFQIPELNKLEDALQPIRPLFEDLIGRLEQFRGEVQRQLRKEPTVFFADPVEEADKVAGAKPGDIAVWYDNTGTQQWLLLTGE